MGSRGLSRDVRVSHPGLDVHILLVVRPGPGMEKKEKKKKEIEDSSISAIISSTMVKSLTQDKTDNELA